MALFLLTGGDSLTGHGYPDWVAMGLFGDFCRCRLASSVRSLPLPQLKIKGLGRSCLVLWRLVLGLLADPCVGLSDRKIGATFACNG